MDTTVLNEVLNAIRTIGHSNTHSYPDPPPRVKPATQYVATALDFTSNKSFSRPFVYNPVTYDGDVYSVIKVLIEGLHPELEFRYVEFNGFDIHDALDETTDRNNWVINGSYIRYQLKHAAATSWKKFDENTHIIINTVGPTVDHMVDLKNLELAEEWLDDVEKLLEKRIAALKVLKNRLEEAKSAK